MGEATVVKKPGSKRASVLTTPRDPETGETSPTPAPTPEPTPAPQAPTPLGSGNGAGDIDPPPPPPPPPTKPTDEPQGSTDPAPAAAPTMTPPPMFDGVRNQQTPQPAPPAPQPFAQQQQPAQPVQQPVPPVQTPAASTADSALLDRINALETQLNAEKQQRVRDDLFNVSIPEDHPDAELLRDSYDTLMRPALERINGFWEQQMQQQEQTINQLKQNIGAISNTTTQQLEENRVATLNTSITSRIPDFASLVNNNEFINKASEQIPGTNTNYWEQISQAYQAGDSGYVVEATNYVKGLLGRPVEPTEPMMAPTGTAAPSAPSAGQSYTHQDLEDMKFKYMRRQVSRKEFMEFSQDFEKAMQEGRVDF